MCVWINIHCIKLLKETPKTLRRAQMSLNRTILTVIDQAKLSFCCCCCDFQPKSLFVQPIRSDKLLSSSHRDRSSIISWLLLTPVWQSMMDQANNYYCCHNYRVTQSGFPLTWSWCWWCCRCCCWCCGPISFCWSCQKIWFPGWATQRNQ